MLSVFTDVVLPVFAMAVLGGLVGRWRNVQTASLSGIVFYLFSPALVFNSLSTSKLSAATGARVVFTMMIVWAVMLAIALAWSRSRHHDPSMRASFMLAMTSANSGNMGLPVSKLAFGEAGLQIAVVNFVMSALITNSVGVAVASSAQHGIKRSIIAPLRNPSLYAALVGLGVRVTGVRLPIAITSPVQTLAGAAIPVMLVVLGMQLKDAATRGSLADTSAVSVARLALAPAMSWVVCSAVGVSGVERATMTVLAGMPVAVIVTILAAEFGGRVDFLTRTVVLTTLVSVLTLTGLIALVR